MDKLVGLPSPSAMPGQVMLAVALDELIEINNTIISIPRTNKEATVSTYRPRTDQSLHAAGQKLLGAMSSATAHGATN